MKIAEASNPFQVYHLFDSNVFFSLISMKATKSLLAENG